ncbi:hypothetical protein M011DRAFT_457047 [Sporormia fimetaria CBS 119925]|uniref:Uncharacterized protein n=1 Tax=Sporormia fimetaria CBS 119925 TaxID=1340428 RepID=A0A6A6VE74_9PLEO|nr:hypothetical protein M011DRAFT_457047 [Sporormia fimetaria CBS 119925]
MAVKGADTGGDPPGRLTADDLGALPIHQRALYLFMQTKRAAKHPENVRPQRELTEDEYATLGIEDRWSYRRYQKVVAAGETDTFEEPQRRLTIDDVNALPLEDRVAYLFGKAKRAARNPTKELLQRDLTAAEIAIMRKNDRWDYCEYRRRISAQKAERSSRTDG